MAAKLRIIGYARESTRDQAVNGVKRQIKIRAGSRL